VCGCRRTWTRCRRFIAPTEDDEKIYGRGSCDAKGIIAAQIVAAEQLRSEGIEDIGLLYTVEEERASTGAKVANDHPIAAKCEYLINGEPTDNDLAIGSKGAFSAKIKTKEKQHIPRIRSRANRRSKSCSISLKTSGTRNFRTTIFWRDDLQHRDARRRHRPQRHSAKCRGWAPDPPDDADEPIRHALESLIRDRGELEVMSYSLPSRCSRSMVSNKRSSGLRPTSRICQNGANRCCSVRGQYSSHILRMNL